MSEFMELLRGPALGVVFMIFLLAGVIIVTAFAALVAQMSLLLRLRPWNTTENTRRSRSERERQYLASVRRAIFCKKHSSAYNRFRTSIAHRQVVVFEPNAKKWLMRSGGKKCSEIKIPGLVEIGKSACLPCLVSSPGEHWRTDEARRGPYGKHH